MCTDYDLHQNIIFYFWKCSGVRYFWITHGYSSSIWLESPKKSVCYFFAISIVEQTSLKKWNKVD